MNWTLAHFLSLANAMARMKLKAEANRLYMSYLWWLIEPIIYALMFYLVFDVLMEAGTDGYMMFLICGKIMFLWFSKTVAQCAYSLVANKGLISSGASNLLVFPLSQALEATYKQIIVFIFLCILVLAFGYGINKSWLWLPVLFLTQFLLILAIGYIASVLVVWAHDFNTLINMGLLLLLFISGVFWDIGSIANESTRDALFFFNPLVFLLDAYRSVFLGASDFSRLHLLSLLIICGLVLSVILVALKNNRGFIANQLEGV